LVNAHLLRNRAALRQIKTLTLAGVPIAIALQKLPELPRCLFFAIPVLLLDSAEKLRTFTGVH
jgi:hypothetical protein